MVKLLVLDLDGTLYNSKVELSEGNRRALLAAQEKGVRVALASGRAYYGLKELCGVLDMPRHNGFVIGNNGQDLFDFRTGTLTKGAKVCREACLQMMAVAKRRGLEVFAHNNEVSAFYSPPHGRKAHPERESRRYDEATGFFEGEDGDMDKIGIFIDGGEEENYEILRELQGLIEPKARCVLTNIGCIELVPPGMDKVDGIDLIVERYGLAREEVLVIGDGQNDLGMARKYPFVAMGNALSEVKAAAIRDTLTNDEDGVAYEVRRTILKE